MNIFDFRDALIGDYKAYVESFINIRDARIREKVSNNLAEGVLWPNPLVQLNPAFEPGLWIDEFVKQGALHQECARIFRIKREPEDKGSPLRLHLHQQEAVEKALRGKDYVLTTGTSSGKSLAFIIPIVDYVLKNGSGKGIRAIIVYPMNALANSQVGELEKYVNYSYPGGKGPITFERYTGQEREEERKRILANPPDILLTNYVMLELILTRPEERELVQAAQGLKFLVFDELHTYRGRQGADVAFLIRRVKQALGAYHLQCIGTSATLAGEGNLVEQRTQVADVVSRIFGARIEPEDVIGETLRRLTPEVDLQNPDFINQLNARISNYSPPIEYDDFLKDTLSIWIESTLGIATEAESGRLVRAKPKSIAGDEGAARALHDLTGVPMEKCINVIQQHLLAGYKFDSRVLAFRLHQFISKGESVYASLETESERYITLSGQQFVPGSREKILLPLVFCRECGQEYYCVRKVTNKEKGVSRFVLRELNDQQNDEDSSVGFLFYSSDKPWPHAVEEIINRIPDDWLEEKNGATTIRQDRKAYLPQSVRVTSNGRQDENGLEVQFIPAPFRFCLNCGVSYNFRQRDDFSKLASLSSEGRSTATTILSLSSLRSLKKQEDLDPTARKLLSFTDNRQDASLQAGHFNDFVEIGLLRSAIYRAALAAGAVGLGHENITQEVFQTLNLPIEAYASNPAARFQALVDTQRALRNVLGYRIYQDLKRGWRITSPNLEQCGLLEIKYSSLFDVCHAEDLWERSHVALQSATPETRMKVAKVLLDFMRRELAIKVDYLDQVFQERIQQQSSQHLLWPWAIDEDEVMVHAAVLYPRSVRKSSDYRGDVFLSPRGGFGLYLRRQNTFPGYSQRLAVHDAETIILDLLGNLNIAGIVEKVIEPESDADVPGYQLKASAMSWLAGDGMKSFHDPIRVPHLPEGGGRTNPFFVNFYRGMAAEMQSFEAREHTAQVPYEDRIEREERFRNGTLPILYCSPTMELGVDIAQLNVVNLRNIPPTPANYAQRSGRAGRSGQPALVFSYCSTGSSHDQYFFKRPERMVGGSVTPPRLDLANEDLVRAHVHAIWLAEAQLSLGSSLKDLLDLSGDEPTLALLPEVRETLEAESPRRRAYAQAEQVLLSVQGDLKTTDWYYDGWLRDVLNQIPIAFESACERWRNLYRSALSQAKAQDKIIRDATRSQEDKKRAERLRRDAESQLKLLTEIENVVQSDFYSYRYFASEGFLPGYSFPRLPLSAYLPGRRTKQRDEFLSRPRFLAISEFGPQSIIYHEGSRYIINKVIMSLQEEDSIETHRAKICDRCGYLHPISDVAGVDNCELCHAHLPSELTQLFRLRNVSTKRRVRINSDEEERLRLGYDLLTTIRFAERGKGLSFRTANIEHEGKTLARLTYGDSAIIWRINLGWRRRRNRLQYGFLLDKERGLWERNDQIDPANDDEAFSARVERVIPYVKDHKNCLLFTPHFPVDQQKMASLQAALKNAIQITYQLEDNELAAEPLPSLDDRRLILFYESAEGGAGVLRRLVNDPQAFASIARQALELCHFAPATGEDQRRAPRAREDCEAACYDCLMNYGNQRDHEFLDRQSIREILLQFTQAQVFTSASEDTRPEHLEKLLRQCSSELEKAWLQFLEANRFRLPSHAQTLIPECQTRPDFLYADYKMAVYIDGPFHDYPERQARDKNKVDCLEDRGYLVVRFGHQNDWQKIIQKYPNVFGAS